MASKLPPGFYIKRLPCSIGGEDYSLYYGTKFIRIECLCLCPRFFAIWRLKRAARFYYKNGIKM